MAAVVGDFMSDSSRYHTHTMIAGSDYQRSTESQYRHRSRSRPGRPSSPRPPQTAVADTPPSTAGRDAEGSSVKHEPYQHVKADTPSTSSSSNPSPDSRTRHPTATQSSTQDPLRNAPSDQASSRSRPSYSSSTSSSVPRSVRSLDDVRGYGGTTIKVRDLAHIQSFATEEFLTRRGQAGRRRTADEPPLKYEISGMPITDIIEMVAGLLTKITTTNDRQHENLHRPVSSAGESSAGLPGLSSSVLAFHGKNVPSITILSYLSRIHKYCPTTYEVFLSLLVYFDRMTERVNATPLQHLQRDAMDVDDSRPSTGYSAEGSDLADSPTSRSAPGSNSELERAQYPQNNPHEHGLAQFPLSYFFVVDSFNIHRLVIAGVTCASKFFSDVFYTNSRYAKVGGLPLAELNHLELQFLLLNDFRLSVPVEELEAYGTMLVEFYAREVINQRQNASGPSDMAYPDEPTTSP
ncbi:cyclin-domain-containing protein [Xylogone sp. PMI_703]|nr:cyclin-domain-containing protein [Xylogone sp. PMI_703]